MSDPLGVVKPAVRRLRAYTLAGRQAPVKLNQNENPYDLPEAVKRRVLDAALRRPWSRYPPFDPQELREGLAALAGWPADGVLAGNGSNELIESLLLVCVGPDTPVLVPEPTFTLYALLTEVLGGRLERVALGPDLAYDPEVLRAAVGRTQPALTIVCSPNNPTGGTLAAEEVARLCAASPGLVVVDEAYHEFSAQTVVPLLADHRNLVVLRTFSKAMSLAGLRVGYLLAAPELVREVDKARLPYNLNFFSQAAALAALGERALLEDQVRRLVGARAALFAELAGLEAVRPFPSEANFILFELERHAPGAVFEGLHRRGVLVRDVSGYPRLQRCLRVSVGTGEENARFVSALREALAEAEEVPA